MKKRFQHFDEFEDYSSQFRVVRTRPKRSNESSEGDGREASQWTARGSAEHGHRPRPQTPADIEFGDVLAAPNELLGFENAMTSEHPCVCLCEWGEQSIALLKGRDGHRLNPRYQSEYVCVEATPANGLRKHTAFKREPLKRPFRRVAQLYPDRHMGRLDASQQEVVFQAVIVPTLGQSGQSA